MWVKACQLFKLPDDFRVFYNLGDLNVALAKSVLHQIGPFEKVRTGFVPPAPSDEWLHHTGSGATMLTMAILKRDVPASVIKDAMRNRIAAYREKMGRTPGKRVREQLKDEVMAELLPRAFVKESRVNAYIDWERKLLVVDSTSSAVGEQVVGLLRQALETFPAEPLATEESVVTILTRWLTKGPDSGFSLGADVDLKDPLNTKATVKVRQHELGTEEVTDIVTLHQNRVSQLALVFDNRVSFTIDEKMTIRKIKFLDIVKEEMGEIAGDDAMAEFDARFTLMVLELRRLFAALDSVFHFV